VNSSRSHSFSVATEVNGRLALCNQQLQMCTDMFIVDFGGCLENVVMPSSTRNTNLYDINYFIVFFLYILDFVRLKRLSTLAVIFFFALCGGSESVTFII